MTSKTYFLIVFIGLSVWFANAQAPIDSLCLQFNIKWNDTKLVLQKKYLSQSDSLEISAFKFYVSGIAVQFDDNSEFIQKNSYHLVNIDQPTSLVIPLFKQTNKLIKNIAFSIGIDSLSSVSGALSGDLDAINGMYWAWQSGFINLKIEGKSSLCKTRKNQFQFHIGGYLHPNYALRKIRLNSKKNVFDKTALEIDINAAALFNQIDLSTNNAVMIPGTEAMKIADLVSKLFYLNE